MTITRQSVILTLNMQPNQPFPPEQDPNQNNDTTDTPASWDDAPATQPIAPQQPAVTTSTPTPIQPAAAPQPVSPDYARYQPQPQPQPQPPQTPTPMPSPIQPTPTNEYFQPATPEAQPITQPEDIQPQEQPTAVDTPAIAPTPPITPVSVSPFEQQYQQALQEPPRKKSHTGLIIAGIIAAVLLIGGSAAGYLWVQDQNDPEKRFYRAIENHLSTAYIQQDYKQIANMGSPIVGTVESSSDFSNPKAPKSQMKYDIESEVAAFDSTGELTVLEDKEYFAKLTQPRDFEGMDSQYLPAINQWYRVDKGDFAGTMLLDPGSMAAHINTITGEVLVGNFSESMRTDLMKHIKEKSVYTINSSEEVTVDGQKMTRYDIKFNIEALNELNKKAIKALGLPDDDYEDQDTDPDQTNMLWIDNATNRIVKVELTRDSSSIEEDGKAVKDTSTVTLRYPTSAPQITKPENAKDVPWSNL